MERNVIYQGDCLEVLKTLSDGSVNCCITSPPYYGLRDYGVPGQLGNENSPEEYIKKLVDVFTEVRRVLADDGTLWVVIADSYAGSNQGAGTKNLNPKQASNKGTVYMSDRNHKSKSLRIDGCKPKDLMGIPWLLAFALRESGWYLRQDIIWAKGNPMPESVKDRCTKSHEYIFLLSKSRKYYFDNKALREPAVSIGDMQRRVKNGHGEWKTKKAAGTYAVSGKARSREELYSKDGMRNKRDVWFVNTKPCKEAHFAVFPDALIEPCVLAGSKKGGVVLDPFMGSGTTAIVAARNGRDYIGIELNPDYVEIANRRIKNNVGLE